MKASPIRKPETTILEQCLESRLVVLRLESTLVRASIEFSERADFNV